MRASAHGIANRSGSLRKCLRPLGRPRGLPVCGVAIALPSQRDDLVRAGGAALDALPEVALPFRQGPSLLGQAVVFVVHRAVNVARSVSQYGESVFARDAQ